MRRIAPLLATMALLAPAPAAADEICVTGPDLAPPAGACDATHASLPAAVEAADASPGLDRVRIGAGTLHYAAAPAEVDDDVEILGAGRDATTLEVGGADGAQLIVGNDPDVLVQDLEVHFTSGHEDMVGVELTGGLARRLDVTGAPGNLGTGLLLYGGDAEDVDARLDVGPILYPVLVDGPDGDTTSIDGLRARGEIGLFIRTTRPVVVRRAELVGTHGGLVIVGAADVVADTFTASGAALDSYATPVFIDTPYAPEPHDADVTLRHASLYVKDTHSSIVVRQSTGGTTDVHLRSSVLDPPGVYLSAGSPDGFDRINLDAEHTSLDPDEVYGETSINASYAYTPGPGAGRVANPRFVDKTSGDLRIHPDSGLVDRGEPADAILGAAALDLLGAARVLDGDGDGDARRDIGAFEVPAVPGPPGDDEGDGDPPAPPLPPGPPGPPEETRPPAPPAPPPPGQHPLVFPPAMTVTASGRLDRRNRTALTLGCPSDVAGACAGEVVLRAAGLRLGAATFRIAPGRKGIVRVRVSRVARRALRRAGSLRVRAAVTSRHTWPALATFTLRPRPRG